MSDLIQELKDLLRTYDYVKYELEELANKINVEELNDLKQNLHNFIHNLPSTECLHNLNEECTVALCNHEWIDDYVDLSPERSERITYCNICLTIKN
jgi:hypothetical protein